MEGVLEVFRCPICLEYAADAVSVKCCQQVFCKACISGIPAPRYCPMCRSDEREVKFSDAIAVQRALDQRVNECPNKCGIKLPHGNLKAHCASSCPKRIVSCPSKECQWPAGCADTLPLHIATAHADKLVAHASRLFEASLSSSSSSSAQRDIPLVIEADSRIEAVRTPSSRASRLGTSGMRYCGGYLPSPACGCCNGRCGPTNGCSCAECMEIETRLRKLPKGWLVNKNGASCRKGITGKYYCGRRQTSLDLMPCDGWCGPTNGPQCNDCAIIQKLASRWYPRLL